MNHLALTVQQDLLAAIDRDDLMLPTLPEVARQIRQAAEDRHIDVSDLSRVIGRDIALSARLIKVVNSPLLRGTREVTGLHAAITRLGVNYSCNLAIGLVMEQIFNARASTVETTLRDIWAHSMQIAGIAYQLCRRCEPRLKPDQAALAGMLHQIGALPVLIYAEEHNELLADPISLNDVIERIHPLVGERLLQKWGFPALLANVPQACLAMQRPAGPADYADLVQVATLLNRPGSSWEATRRLDSWQRLGLGEHSPLSADELCSARQLLA